MSRFGHIPPSNSTSENYLMNLIQYSERHGRQVWEMQIPFSLSLKLSAILLCLEAAKLFNSSPLLSPCTGPLIYLASLCNWYLTTGSGNVVLSQVCFLEGYYLAGVVICTSTYLVHSYLNKLWGRGIQRKGIWKEAD